MAPPRRVVSKASPALRKNPAAKAQLVTPSKGKASPSKKTGDEEECAFFLSCALLLFDASCSRISIDSDSDDVKEAESKTPTKKAIQ
jgi:hypothetical protein